MSIFEKIIKKFKSPTDEEKSIVETDISKDDNKINEKETYTIPNQILSQFMNTTILPLNVNLSKQQSNSTYLIQLNSKIKGLFCYDIIDFCPNTSEICKLYTIYSERKIDKFFFENNKQYREAVRNILLPMKLLENKCKFAELYGLKKTCYVGHLTRNKHSTDDKAVTYSIRAFQGDGEDLILRTIAKVNNCDRNPSKNNSNEREKFVKQYIPVKIQKETPMLIRKNDIIRLQELESSINGLRKYLMTYSNNAYRTFYSEGIDLNLLINKDYNKLIVQLLSENRLEEKEMLAKNYSTNSCYVGTVVTDEDGNFHIKDTRDEKEIYLKIKKYDNRQIEHTQYTH